MTNNNLGTRISDLLKQNGLAQKDLAQQVGVTEVSMSRYVNGDRTPRDLSLLILPEFYTQPLIIY